MVSKKLKLFVPHLSGFWLRKILLDSPKKKIFPAETKKNGGNKWAGPPIPKEGKIFIQQVPGMLLYYGQAVDSAILVALSTIALHKPHPPKTQCNKLNGS